MQIQDTYVNPFFKENEQSLKHYRDLKNSIDAAFSDGKLEGEAIGLVKGEAVGLSKGEAIGEIKGMANALLQLLENRFGQQPDSLQQQLLMFNKTQPAHGLQSVFQADSVMAIMDAMRSID